MNQTLFFSVGEPSGDLHGANLIRALRGTLPGWHVTGLGGPRMREAGCDLVTDLTQLAVMWVGNVLVRLPQFWQLLREVESRFQQSPPAAVILIDYPGFNWHVARRAKAHGIPVIYYGVPQLWAWAPWRARKMRQRVDLALCKLPFEEPWLRARGIPAEYVGHPYFDELARRELDGKFLHEHDDGDRPLVTLLPGSRRQEVEAHTDWMLDTVKILGAARPQLRFAFACYDEQQADLVRTRARRATRDVKVFAHRTAELIELAICTMACSGSVSLELLYHGKPSVIVYRVGVGGYLLQDILRTARYITLANLLAAPSIGRRPFQRLRPDERSQLPFPEFLAVRNCAPQLAGVLGTWLDQPTALQAKRQLLLDLRRQWGTAGASARAAQRIAALLRDRPGLNLPAPLAAGSR